jgi:hypothetical protein
MLQVRAYVERIAEGVGPDEFRDARYREIFATLLRLGPDCLADELAAALSPGAVAVLDELVGEPDAIQNFERTVRDCLTRLEVRTLRERSDEIKRLLRTATVGEKDLLIEEKVGIAEEIRRLSEGGPSA